MPFLSQTERQALITLLAQVLITPQDRTTRRDYAFTPSDPLYLNFPLAAPSPMAVATHIVTYLENDYPQTIEGRPSLYIFIESVCMFEQGSALARQLDPYLARLREVSSPLRPPLTR